jgi:hypothetical protein
MTYTMHTAGPDEANHVYSAIQALELLIAKLNNDATSKQYESIVSAFPLGGSAVVITETMYHR